MSIQLVMPSIEYWNSYKESYHQTDHEGCVDGMDWDGRSLPDKYFLRAQEISKGQSLGELVPCTNFWIVKGDEYVGRMSIRHELNEFLEKYGGHIGYEVKTSARKKRIATKALGLALDFCKQELNLREVMLTCDDTNIPSIKTIESNGGLLRNKSEFDGRISRYYLMRL